MLFFLKKEKKNARKENFKLLKNLRATVFSHFLLFLFRPFCAQCTYKSIRFKLNENLEFFLSSFHALNWLLQYFSLWEYILFTYFIFFVLLTRMFYSSFSLAFFDILLLLFSLYWKWILSEFFKFSFFLLLFWISIDLFFGYKYYIYFDI